MITCIHRLSNVCPVLLVLRRHERTGTRLLSHVGRSPTSRGSPHGGHRLQYTVAAGQDRQLGVAWARSDGKGSARVPVGVAGRARPEQRRCIWSGSGCREEVMESHWFGAGQVAG
jgi:hypothetical protein